MKLAVNWSPQAEELFVAKKIKLDLWKCSDWPELVEPALKTGPAYVHFPIRAGDGSIPDWAKVRMWMEKTGTKLVNMHLHVGSKDMPDIPYDSRSPEHCERVIDALVRDVQAAGDEMGIDNIVVENLPTYRYDDGFHPLHCCIEPGTISAVIERTGCMLLLDIDHARSAGKILGVDPHEYIESLPVKRIGEFHMTGVRRENGALEGHRPMAKEDWEYFDWAIENFRSGAWKTPGTYAFEYGGIGPNFKENSNIDVLAEQVPILFKKVHSLSK